MRQWSCEQGRRADYKEDMKKELSKKNTQSKNPIEEKINNKIQFTIFGNQENPNGNPIPKLKMTGRQQWTPQAQRYAAWKKYVQLTFLDGNFKQEYTKRFFNNHQKPIGGTPNAHMDLKIEWANGKHADPESVFGSIADALFENDNNLDGSFVAKMALDGIGKVEISISI